MSSSKLSLSVPDPVTAAEDLIDSLTKSPGSTTWWHTVAALAALAVSLADPGHAISSQVQTAVVGLAALITSLDVFGRHSVKRAAVNALAASKKAVPLESGSTQA